ncbi:MAG: hypothetical protein F6K24_48440 [Okeania sp. SIO2D1]|nr:hypothetical protein [Okeania sp. SIO2D1]
MKEEGRRKKEEGRRKKEEGRRKKEKLPARITLGYNYKIVNLLFLKEEGRRKKEEGKIAC